MSHEKHAGIGKTQKCLCETHVSKIIDRRLIRIKRLGAPHNSLRENSDMPCAAAAHQRKWVAFYIVSRLFIFITQATKHIKPNCRLLRSRGLAPVRCYDILVVISQIFQVRAHPSRLFLAQVRQNRLVTSHWHIVNSSTQSLLVLGVDFVDWHLAVPLRNRSCGR